MEHVRYHGHLRLNRVPRVSAQQYLRHRASRDVALFASVNSVFSVLLRVLGGFT